MKQIKGRRRLVQLLGAAAAVAIGNLAAACGSSTELAVSGQAAEGIALAGEAAAAEGALTLQEAVAEGTGEGNAGKASTDQETIGKEATGKETTGKENKAGEEAAAAENGGSTAQTDEAPEADPAWIYVDVCGAVEQPGVYCLEEGARVCDAVRAAGGFSLAAVETSVNQARILTDQEQLYIYTQEELEALQAGEYPGATAGAVGLDRASGTGDGTGKTLSASDGAGTSSGSDGGTDRVKDGKVDLNTATAAQLQTLPGIGAAKAEAILSYRRENGSFRSAEELKKVSGIGDATYAGLEAYITVGS